MDQPQPVSSRSSFSDPQIVVQGPIPLFDTHLKRLSDSYLSFFQERCVFALHALLHGLLMSCHAENGSKKPSMLRGQLPIGLALTMFAQYRVSEETP